MKHQRIKTFWINKINDLRTNLGSEPTTADWENQINQTGNWADFELLGTNICQEIYDNSTVIAPVNILTNAENYSNVLANAFSDLEGLYDELVEVFKDDIGVDPTDPDTTDITDDTGTVTNTVLTWKHIINERTYNEHTRLADIPDGTDIAELLYSNDLYSELTDNATGLPGIIENGLTGADVVKKYGIDWNLKVNDKALNNYRNFVEVTNFTRLCNLLEIDINDPIPNDWCSRLVKKTDLDTANASITNLTPKANDYDRIHAKLNGKVSDSDLDTLKNNSPSCSHTDYDAIKDKLNQVEQEHQNCPAEKTQASQQKEREIIDKIITDLSLSTERERALEAVITEIKAKINPPTDSGKDTKIRELEAQITNLKQPKSLSDLPISNGIKEEVIKMSKELGLNAQSFTKLQNAKSYQELSALQQEAFQEKLNSEASRRNNAHYLNYVLGTLTLGSLIVLVFMLWKMAKRDVEKIFPKKDKE